jgi:NAD+ diphosphatase
MADAETAPLTFTDAALDRAAHLRADAAAVADLAARPSTRFVVVSRRRVLTAADGGALVLDRTALGFDPAAPVDPPILLGLDGGGRATMALRLTETAARDAFGDDAPFADLRTAGAALTGGDAALAAYACALDHWHGETAHCSVCGAPTDAVQGGHVRRCTDAACGRDHFPRIDPAVIVRIVHPDPGGDAARDRILLARQANWPEGRYSVLAGFCEPGESLEQTVEREMAEEAGVRVADIRYVASQPWPFPRSLMVGFEARALSDALHLGDDELADAQWLTRADLHDWEAAGKILSSRISISYRLIRDWMDEPV